MTALAGTRKVVETTRRLSRFPFWAHQGTSRLRDVPVVDSSLIRGLDVGQVAYLFRGGVTYVQVKRLVASPAAVSAPVVALPAPVVGAPGVGAPGVGGPGVGGPGVGAPVVGAPGVGAAAPAPPAGVGQEEDSARQARSLPDVSSVLDAAFGPEVVS